MANRIGSTRNRRPPSGPAFRRGMEQTAVAIFLRARHSERRAKRLHRWAECSSQRIPHFLRQGRQSIRLLAERIHAGIEMPSGYAVHASWRRDRIGSSPSSDRSRPRRSHVSASSPCPATSPLESTEKVYRAGLLLSSDEMDSPRLKCGCGAAAIFRISCVDLIFNLLGSPLLVTVAGSLAISY